MRIAYAVPHPVRGAVGQRIHGLSRAILATGLVSHVSIVATDCDSAIRDEPGVEFAEVGQLLQGPSLRSKVARRLAAGTDSVRALGGLQPRPDALLVYGGGAMYMSTLQGWARRNNLPMAADMVEWYDATHLPLGRFGPHALDNHIMMTRTARNCDGVIAISTFLAKHFTDLGNRNVITIPPLLTSCPAPAKPKTGGAGIIEFAYCGIPGKKDRLDLVLRSVIHLDPQGERMRLTIAGPDPAALANLAGVEELPPVIQPRGPVDRAESLEIVGGAHWMPLVRDSRRFAHAGFPMKAAEALTLGTPLIANITSDLGKVLTDGRTGIVVAQADIAAICHAVNRALEMESDEYLAIADRALARAREFFDPTAHLAELSRWLIRVTGRAQ